MHLKNISGHLSSRRPVKSHSKGWAQRSILMAIAILALTPHVAYATADEEPGQSRNLPLSTTSSSTTSPITAPAKQVEPLQISELPTSPYIAGQEQSEQFRRQSTLIANYIQNYNRQLSWDQADGISRAIVQYSGRYGVDYRLLTSIIAVESAFRRDAISSSGAIGMGQLKPDTARWLGVVDPYDPVDNIAGTARFLSWLVRRYNGNLEYALSAYYQGPGSVDREGVTPVCMPYLTKVNRALGSLL
jgi:soluble lytic murein transglycosylase-like protein